MTKNSLTVSLAEECRPAVLAGLVACGIAAELDTKVEAAMRNTRANMARHGREFMEDSPVANQISMEAKSQIAASDCILHLKTVRGGTPSGQLRCIVTAEGSLPFDP